MIESGAQIRAARALLGWTRVDLAEAADLKRVNHALGALNPVLVCIDTSCLG